MSGLFDAAIQAVLQEDALRCQALCDEYLLAAKELNLRGAQIASLYLSGSACLIRGDYAAAVAAYAEGLAGMAEMGDQVMGAWFGNSLGLSLLLLGEYDRAEAALEAALEAFTRTGFRFGSIETLVALGYVALEKQEAGRARGLFEQAAEQSIAIGFRSELPDCLNGLTGVALLENDLLRAAQLYGAVDGLAQRLGAHGHVPALIPFSRQHEAALRQRMAPAVLKRAWQEGREMSVAEALAAGR